MKQLRKTEWQKGYPIKKNLALCACVLALAGAVLTLPHLIRYCRKTYHSMPALNKRLTKEEQEELVEHEIFKTITAVDRF